MSPQHLVQFYGSSRDALIVPLSKYVRDGVNAGESVVAVAALALHDAIFAASGEDRRLIVLDSDKMLQQISEGGRVCPNRFDQIVGSMLREVISRARSNRVRVYGDMVDTLWRGDRKAEAIELERYWNDLQAQLPFDLYCAYGVDVMDDRSASEEIAPVLCEHTAVVPND